MNVPFFSRRENDLILAIEIKSGSLRAALVRPAKRPPVIACEYCPVAESFGEAVEGIRSLVERAGNRLKQTFLILNREEVLIKNFSVSSAKPEETAREIEEKIPQLIPYDISEVVRDWSLVEKKDFENKVLFVVAHRRVVDEKLEQLKAVPLVPDRALISSEAILAACRELNFRWVGPGGVLVMDVDQESSELIYLNQNQIIFSKKTDLGREDFEAEDPVVFSNLFREIEILMQAPADKIKGMVKRVVLTGAPPAGRHLESRLKDYFWFEPNFLKLEGQGSVAFSLTALFGAAYASLGKPINLLPEEIKKEKNREEKAAKINRILYAGSAFLMAAALLGSGHLGFRKYFLSTLEAELKQLKPRVAALEETAEGLRLRAGHERDKWLLLETLAALHKTTPPEVLFKKIDYDHEKGVTLRGVAKTNAQVTGLFGRVRRLPKTDRWVLDYSQEKRLRGQSGFEFQMRFSIRGEPA